MLRLPSSVLRSVSCKISAARLLTRSTRYGSALGSHRGFDRAFRENACVCDESLENGLDAESGSGKNSTPWDAHEAPTDPFKHSLTRGVSLSATVRSGESGRHRISTASRPPLLSTTRSNTIMTDHPLRSNAESCSQKSLRANLYFEFRFSAGPITIIAA